MWTEVYIAFGIQWIAWIFAVIFKTEKFYDLTGGITFVTILHYILWTRSVSLTASQLIQQFCVLAWAIRLSAFLFWRVLSKGEDRRFRQIKKSPLRFLVVWTVQGVWVIVTLLPSLLMWHKTLRPDKGISNIETIGWLIWAFGFILEVAADYQKSQFRSKPENKDAFIQTGLWSLCRHPNYLGEIVLWFGLFVSASSTYSALDYVAIVGPLFVATLLIRVSGVPILEAYADKKWSDSSDYQRYKANTALLVPFVW